ncbi:haloacetate dehalogenase H-1 [Fusarium tjaetaba]|uniref:Haloacetate dehalogenase H-1 n=1 Tax=Fusarium tjaetaba TaxID=1567544 RepID=A0A8H5RID6_9HYPO|nr:haloacetate dehalogenase H-1 [Fusarium tjaetaba]KAF5633837.1 haloacetate dehalogenase H-1 [Fusarium tjaetaba]
MATDMLRGFTRQFIETADGVSIFVRTKIDSGKPPLLLLHGFPQTHVEYHHIVHPLVPHFSVILLDLRGYGQSATVPSTNGSGYSKRLMANDCISVMSQLGYNKFLLVGHDRGARVAYRLAFDHPEAILRLVVIDIIPTAAMFQGFGDVTAGLKAYHWLFLAQPDPFPEKVIKGADNGKHYLEHTLASWTRNRTLDDFDERALEEYRKAYCNEARIHSTCEDYRAGAFLDKVYDEKDLQEGNKIQAPMLAIWGNAGVSAESLQNKSEGPLEIWQKYARNVRGKALECGHFIPEEDPEGLTEVLIPFLLEQ